VRPTIFCRPRSGRAARARTIWTIGESRRGGSSPVVGAVVSAPVDPVAVGAAIHGAMATSSANFY
jgi:hypothetical protein